MQFNTEPQRLHPTRSKWLLCWFQYLFFCIAILAIGYCGLTLFDAWNFQTNAKRLLTNQVSARQGAGVPSRDLEFREAGVLGRMEIPRLGMSVAVLEGTGQRILRMGVGHIEGTPLPGASGNSGIAGHRDTFFRKLAEIRRNDEIRIQTENSLTRYEVDWIKVVDPDDSSVLAPADGPALTLVTCYPFYFVGASPKRFIVHARLRR